MIKINHTKFLNKLSNYLIKFSFIFIFWKIYNIWIYYWFFFWECLKSQTRRDSLFAVRDVVFAASYTRISVSSRTTRLYSFVVRCRCPGCCCWSKQDDTGTDQRESRREQRPTNHPFVRCLLAAGCITVRSASSMQYLMSGEKGTRGKRNQHSHAQGVIELSTVNGIEFEIN